MTGHQCFFNQRKTGRTAQTYQNIVKMRLVIKDLEDKPDILEKQKR